MYRLREINRNDIAALSCAWGFSESWYDMYMTLRKTNICCAIVDSEASEAALGFVRLFDIDALNQSAKLDVSLETTDTNAACSGVKELIAHAFLNLNINRIEVSFADVGDARPAFFEELGFMREVVRREALCIEGKFVDLIVMSLLRSDENYV